MHRSYPYLLRWLEEHPYKKRKDAYLFINTGHTNFGEQLHPKSINKMLKQACTALGINKSITCYSLKRSGVTLRRLRGDSDMEIQHAARWSSSKQLKTYDLSNQDEAFTRELEKRGIVTSKDPHAITSKTCAFCDTKAGFGDKLCSGCLRPLDRKSILIEQESMEKHRDEMVKMQERMNVMMEEMMKKSMMLKSQNL